MTFHIKKFWTAYKPSKDGEMTPVDMVAYAPVGDPYSVQIATVSRLSKVMPIAGNEDNPAIFMANERWNQIEPRYRAWKENNEIPETGTPLGGWSGINQETAEVFRSIGLRTVEEFAEASEGVIARIRLPNMKPLQQQAKVYLDGKDRVAVASELAEKDQQLAAMQAEIEEMKALMKAAKKPARRRKVEAA